MKTLAGYLSAILCLIFIPMLSACGAVSTPDPAILSHLSTQAGANSANLPELISAPIHAQAPPGGQSSSPSVPDEAPLRFTLPTPGPAPQSLWRPPLYETPWALSPYDHFYFSRPIAADEVNWPEADYRYGGIFFSSDIVHTGIDIPAPLHTPVLAAGDGRVIWAGYGLYAGTNEPNDPYGLAVTIRHTFGYEGRRIYTVYAHMDRIDVVTGQDVKTGDPLGIIGTTGNTTGPHLHFEVRMEKNSFYTTYNPELWLAPPQGWGVLVGRLLNTNGSLLYQQAVKVRNLNSGQNWTVRSYGNTAVNSDPYYQENLVLSDLPEGEYEISIDYLDKIYRQGINIHPGAVSYFTFQGARAFRLDSPPIPDINDLVNFQEP